MLVCSALVRVMSVEDVSRLLADGSRFSSNTGYIGIPYGSLWDKRIS